MPELPDISLYVEHLASRIQGLRLDRVRLRSAFVLRTVDPEPAAFEGLMVRRVGHQAKRIVLGFERGLCCAIHLMIAGRLHWRDPGAAIPGRNGLAAWDFESGTLVLTEASKKKRAAIHLVKGDAALAALDRGGLDPLTIDLDTFRARLAAENHTLKRALTDQRLLAGIGNAYSDEILFAAGLSPFKRTADLSPAEWERLHRACRKTLEVWIERLREQTGDEFPRKVTAFRPEMAVHGRYRQPCPVCGAPVQRIVYAENEANYCARCQTGGRLLADRALSRLLKASWPKTIDELE